MTTTASARVGVDVGGTFTDLVAVRGDGSVEARKVSSTPDDQSRGVEDALAAAWAKSRFPSTRLRIPMVNGERDHFRRLERYLWRMLDGGPMSVHGTFDDVVLTRY